MAYYLGIRRGFFKGRDQEFCSAHLYGCRLTGRTFYGLALFGYRVWVQAFLQDVPKDWLFDFHRAMKGNQLIAFCQQAGDLTGLFGDNFQ